MTTLFIATGNRHKVAEIQSILGDDFRYLTSQDVANPPSVVEDASTFAGNAAKKAIELARWVGAVRPSECPIQSTLVIADDSGLEVDALDGAPGVYSARFAAMDTDAMGNSRDEDNNAKLLRLIANVPIENRGARFRCVIALVPVLPASITNSSPVYYADELELQTEFFDGVCEGRIQFAASGSGGFGYDPLFVPAGFTQSFAELGEQEKNRISHRAQALKKLKARLTRSASAASSP